MSEKITVTCKIHGYFNVRAGNHKYVMSGCPTCNSSKGALLVYNYLKSQNIKFTQEKTFNDCFDICLLPFDFYLPDYNTLIERDGEQHYENVEFFDSFESTKKHDKIKDEFALSHKINLIRISYEQDEIIPQIISDAIQKVKYYHIIITSPHNRLMNHGMIESQIQSTREYSQFMYYKRIQ